MYIMYTVVQYMPLLVWNLHLAAFLDGFEPIGVAQTSPVAKLNTAAGRLVVVEHGYTGPTQERWI
jgi:hypothetical protein